MDGDVLTHFETDSTKSPNKSIINFFLSLTNEVWPFRRIVSLNLEMAHQSCKELCKKSPINKTIQK